MKKNLLFVIFFCVFSFASVGQRNAININATLDTLSKKLLIQQEITYYNTSDSLLSKIYLHNWANSFKDRKTPLSKRFIEDFNKELYFAPKEELGFSELNTVSVDYEVTAFNEVSNQPDIIEIPLKKNLHPNDSIQISTTYIVKIPHSKFTGYGYDTSGFSIYGFGT